MELGRISGLARRNTEFAGLARQDVLIRCQRVERRAGVAASACRVLPGSLAMQHACRARAHARACVHARTGCV
eukprot:14328569-Alexandrium_andersonii.AAC.1